MADLGLGAHALLAAGSGLFALSGVALGNHYRRAELDRAERRESRKEVLAAYTTYLALATEFDSRLDLFTPEPAQLGRFGATSELRKFLADSGQDSDVIGEIPILVDSATLPGLKDLLARLTSTASAVQILGSPKVGEVARELVSAQRRWLLCLEQNDPAAAADALIEARPKLGELRAVFAQDLDKRRSSDDDR